MNALRTTQEARDALASELDDVDDDNPVAAVRAVAKVARDFHAEAPSSWDAFRHVAVEAVTPHFERRDAHPAKAAVWAVVDPYFGQLDHDRDHHGDEDLHDGPRTTAATGIPDDVVAALTGRAS